MHDRPLWARALDWYYRGGNAWLVLSDPWDFGLYGDAAPYTHLFHRNDTLWRMIHSRRVELQEAAIRQARTEHSIQNSF